MFFQGLITIAPGELAHVQRRKPTKAFGKMAHFLTLGLSSPREEQETFTAVSVLQQLNNTLHAIGVDNIVRLSKDKIDFYYDDQGIPQDLRQCMDHFEREIDPRDNELFNEIAVVLEHHHAQMTFLVQINVLRSHEVGEHPIEIHVNAFSNAYPLNDAGEADLRARLAPIFQKQEIYDAFLIKQRGMFDQFIGDIVMAIHTHMHVRAVRHSTKQKIIIPGEGARAFRSDERTPLNYEPAFHHYHGIGCLFWHAWLWAELCQEFQIASGHAMMVDETGAELGTAQSFATADYAQPPEKSRWSGDTGGGGGSSAGGGDGGSYLNVEQDGDKRSGGWFDSLFGEDGFFSGDGDGGSSCGGGCGGGCGGD